jgi:oxalate---CoA ligase
MTTRAEDYAPATLTELIRASARQWPERVAVGVCASDGVLNGVLTYRELKAAVDELATELARRGVCRQDTVAVAGDNCVEQVVALFALAAVGASAALLNPRTGSAQFADRLRQVHARATIVPAHLHGEHCLRQQIPASPPVWKLAVDLHAQTEGVARVELTGPRLTDRRWGATAPPRPADPALLMLTSGTTSAPKVVPLTHANLMASVNGISGLYRLTPQDATLVVMPVFHGHGLIAGLIATLVSGGSAYLPGGGRFSAGDFWSEMAAAQATWFTAGPTINRILLARAAEGTAREYPALRFIRSCGAPLAPAALRQLEATFAAPALEAYGMTEAAHQIAATPLPGDGPAKPGSVGPPAAVELQVTRPDGRPARVGEQGEVWIRGDSVASGYLGDPRATAAGLSHGWFRTGDVGHVDADGYLFLGGRMTEVVDRGTLLPSVVGEVRESSAVGEVSEV